MRRCADPDRRHRDRRAASAGGRRRPPRREPLDRRAVRPQSQLVAIDEHQDVRILGVGEHGRRRPVSSEAGRSDDGRPPRPRCAPRSAAAGIAASGSASPDLLRSPDGHGRAPAPGRPPGCGNALMPPAPPPVVVLVVVLGVVLWSLAPETACVGRDAGRARRSSQYVAARRPALVRTAYLLCGDAHLAEDLVQGALVKAVASLAADRRPPGAVAAQGDRQRPHLPLAQAPGRERLTDVGPGRPGRGGSPGPRPRRGAGSPGAAAAGGRGAALLRGPDRGRDRPRAGRLGRDGEVPAPRRAGPAARPGAGPGRRRGPGPLASVAP